MRDGGEMIVSFDCQGELRAEVADTHSTVRVRSRVVVLKRGEEMEKCTLRMRKERR